MSNNVSASLSSHPLKHHNTTGASLVQHSHGTAQHDHPNHHIPHLTNHHSHHSSNNHHHPHNSMSANNSYYSNSFTNRSNHPSQTNSSNFMLNPATYSTLIGQLNSSIDNSETELIRKILHRNSNSRPSSSLSTCSSSSRTVGQTGSSSTSSSSATSGSQRSTDSALNHRSNILKGGSNEQTSGQDLTQSMAAAAAAAAAVVLNHRSSSLANTDTTHARSSQASAGSRACSSPTRLQQMAQTQLGIVQNAHQATNANNDSRSNSTNSTASSVHHHPYYHQLAAAVSNSAEQIKRPSSSASSSSSSLYVVDPTGNKLNLLDLPTHEFVQNNVSKFSDLDQHHQQLLTHMLGAAGASSLADLPQLKKSLQNGTNPGLGVPNGTVPYNHSANSTLSSSASAAHTSSAHSASTNAPSQMFVAAATAADIYYQQLFQQQQQQHSSNLPNLPIDDSQDLHDDDASGSGSCSLSVSTNNASAPPVPPVKSNRGRKKSNKGPFICTECRKEFTNQSTLTKHMITHSDERRFVCPQCSKAFKRHDHLTGHLVTHREQKPYACEIEGCDKSYCDARSLRRHREKHGKLLAESLSNSGLLDGGGNEQALYTTAASAQLQYLALQQNTSTPEGALSSKHSATESLHHDSDLGHSDESTGFEPKKSLAPATTGPESQYFVGQPRGGNPLLHHLLTNSLSKPLSLSQQQQQQQQQQPQIPQPQSRPPSSSLLNHPSYLEADQNNNSIGHQILSKAHQLPAPHHGISDFHSNHFQDYSVPDYSLHSQREAYARSGAILDQSHSHRVPSQATHPQTQSQHQPQQAPQQQASTQQQPPPQQAHFKIPSSYLYSSSVQQQQQQPQYSMFDPRSALNSHPHQQHTQNSQLSLHGADKSSSQCDNRAIQSQQQQASQQQQQRPAVPPAPTHKVPHPQLHEVMFSPITPVTPLNHKPAFTFDFVQPTATASHSTDNVVVDVQQQQQQQQIQQATPIVAQRQQQQPPNTPQPQELLHVPDNVQGPEVVVHSPNILPGTPRTPTIVVTSPLIEPGVNQAQAVPDVDMIQEQQTQQQSQQQNELNIAHSQSNFDQFDLPSGKLTSDLYNRRLRKHLASHNQNGGQDSDSARAREEIMSIKNSLKSFSQSYEKKRLWQQHQQQQQQQQQQQMLHHSSHMQNSPQFNDAPSYLTHSYQVPNTPLVLCGGGNTAAQFMQDYPSNGHTQNSCPNNVASNPTNGYHHSLPNTPIDNSSTIVFNFNFPDAATAVADQLTPDNSSDTPSSVGGLENGNGGSTAPGADAAQNVVPSAGSSAQVAPTDSTYCFDSSQFGLESNIPSFVDDSVSYQSGMYSEYDSRANLANVPTAVPSDATETFHSHDFEANNTSLPLFSTEAIESISLEPPANSVEPLTITAEKKSNDTVEPTHVNKPSPEKHHSTGKVIPRTTTPTKERQEGNSSNSPEKQYSHELIAGQKRSPLSSTFALTPKKRRPGPLYIPPHVSSLQFQSHLRSPRVRKLPQSTDSNNNNNADNNDDDDDSVFLKPFSPRVISPPPYTPPPILSPIRSGSGLFWKIKSSFGKLKARKPSRHSSVLGESSDFETEPDLESEAITDLDSSVETPNSANSTDDTPETDIQPHVNVGPRFQARIPELRKRNPQTKYLERAQSVISGSMLSKEVPLDELFIFEQVVKSELVRGKGISMECSLHQLNKCSGNVMKALGVLLKTGKHDTPSPVPGYSYPKFYNSWSELEVKKFERAILKYDKDFFMIAREVSSKNTRECVEFYYSWKNCVSVKFLNKLRFSRRKREREILKENSKNSLPVSNTSSALDAIDDTGLDDSKDDNDGESIGGSSGSRGSSTRGTIYKCVNCNKGFKKQRSRATHMIHCK